MQAYQLTTARQLLSLALRLLKGPISCRNFAIGHCRYGDSCWFTHVPLDAPANPSTHEPYHPHCSSTFEIQPVSCYDDSMYAVSHFPTYHTLSHRSPDCDYVNEDACLAQGPSEVQYDSHIPFTARLAYKGALEPCSPTSTSSLPAQVSSGWLDDSEPQRRSASLPTLATDPFATLSYDLPSLPITHCFHESPSFVSPPSSPLTSQGEVSPPPPHHACGVSLGLTAGPIIVHETSWNVLLDQVPTVDAEAWSLEPLPCVFELQKSYDRMRVELEESEEEARARFPNIHFSHLPMHTQDQQRFACAVWALQKHNRYANSRWDDHRRKHKLPGSPFKCTAAHLFSFCGHRAKWLGTPWSTLHCLPKQALPMLYHLRPLL